MNVYIDELASTMNASGVDVVVFTRRTDPLLPREVEAAGGYKVVHIDAGPAESLPISSLPVWVAPFAQGVIDWIDLEGVPTEERELVLQLTRDLYSLVEVRFYVSSVPPWGECLGDRTWHTRAPA